MTDSNIIRLICKSRGTSSTVDPWPPRGKSFIVGEHRYDFTHVADGFDVYICEVDHDG